MRMAGGRANLLLVHLLTMRIYKSNGPLGTSLQGETLHSKNGVIIGVEGFGKILQVWYIGLLLRPQPDKNPRWISSSLSAS
jgi:hypothetical protein